MTVPKFKDFERIVFFTGAGLSVESGIPTYRGEGGRWHEYNYKEYACQLAFEVDPQKVWDFHDKRRVEAASCVPNRAHEIIAQVQKEKPNTVVITQNIDGLLQRAGAVNVIELHGSLWKVRCNSCDFKGEDLTAPIADRKCKCGEILRPDIVWFGDMLDSISMPLARKATQECDLFVAVGTSGSVFPAANLPLYAPPTADTVEVNISETEMSHVYDYKVRGTASEMLAMMLGD